MAYIEDQRGAKSIHLGKILSNKAVSDLSRARETAMKDLKDAKYQLKALLLRNNINSKVNDNWSLQHLR